VYFQVSTAGFVEDRPVENQERGVNAKSRNRDLGHWAGAALEVTFAPLGRGWRATGRRVAWTGTGVDT
jgi:hypothetical protein